MIYSFNEAIWERIFAWDESLQVFSVQVPVNWQAPPAALVDNNSRFVRQSQMKNPFATDTKRRFDSFYFLQKRKDSAQSSNHKHNCHISTFKLLHIRKRSAVPYGRNETMARFSIQFSFLFFLFGAVCFDTKSHRIWFQMTYIKYTNSNGLPAKSTPKTKHKRIEQQQTTTTTTTKPTKKATTSNKFRQRAMLSSFVTVRNFQKKKKIKKIVFNK